MDGVNELDENGIISYLLDPDAKKQTIGKKSQKWPNLRDKKWHFTHYFIIRQNTETKHTVLCCSGEAFARAEVKAVIGIA
ncbi:hypothetical protein Hanom_Chr12g01163221 [Helianthus anomalus]